MHLRLVHPSAGKRMLGDYESSWPTTLVRRISEGREQRRRDVAAEREFKEMIETRAGRRVYRFHRDVKLNSRPRGGDWERRQRYRRQANARRTRLTLASQDRYHDIIEKHLEKVRRGQRKGRAGLAASAALGLGPSA